MARRRTQPSGEPLTLVQIAALLYHSGDRASFRFRSRPTKFEEREMTLMRSRPEYSDDEDIFWYSFGTDWRGKLRVYGGPKSFQRRLLSLLRNYRFRYPIEVEEID